MTGIEFPLIEGVGEQVPLPDDSFDIVLSEYGASLWADPDLWVPEAARLLRPGGRLVFLTNSVLVYLCSPDVGRSRRRLQRPQFGMYRISWPDEPGTEYNLAHGDWVRLLRRHGFEIEDLIEPQVPPTAQDARVLCLHQRRMGSPVAGRGDLGRPTARLTVRREQGHTAA